MIPAAQTLRNALTDEVCGHMPARGFETAAWYVRGSAQWGFDRVVQPLVGVLDEIYQRPGIADFLGEPLHERLRSALNGEMRG